jgi:hypothetical protein
MDTMEQNQNPVQQAPVKTSYGALVGLLAIVAVIVVGAFYLLNQRLEEPEIQQLTEQGDSTDPAEIEQDLSNQSPDEFDQDLDKAFVELNAAFEEEVQ